MNVLFFVAALLYLMCAFVPSNWRRLILYGTALAWGIHGAALWLDIVAPEKLRLGFSSMGSITLWLTVAGYWLGNRRIALDGFRILVLPCAACAAVLPVFFPGIWISLPGQSLWFVGHILIATLAYGTLTVAVFHATLMAIQSSQLHTHGAFPSYRWFHRAIDRLPALLTMEKWLFQLVTVGFVLLTLTVLSGIVFSEQLFGQAFRWDHKTIFTLLSWILFGALLTGHHWQGWRGKIALRFVLFGFTLLLLAYMGSRFVLEVILHRSV